MAILVRHAIKTAIAATLLGAYFKTSNSIEILHYPVMGLVATMQSDLGGTVKGAWGRLGGSAIGGAIGALLLSTMGPIPFSGGLAFLFATLLCDYLQLPSLFSQAGLIACLVSLSALGHGDNPWVYAANRVLDNGIGIAIGTGVTLLFWPDNPRQKLINNSVKFLEYYQQLLDDIHQRFTPHLTHLDPQDLIIQLRQALWDNDKILEAASYGGLGSELVQERWQDYFRHKRLLLRYLLMTDSSCKTNFVLTLDSSVSHNLTNTIGKIIVILDYMKISIQHFPRQHLTILQSLPKEITQLKKTLANLEELILTASLIPATKLQIYPIFYCLLKMTQELGDWVETLQASPQSTRIPSRSSFWTLAQIPRERFSYLLKTALAIAVIFWLLNDIFHLPYNYYAIMGLILTMQPTLEKGLVTGQQRIICTLIAGGLALMLVNTLGANYGTLSLGIIAVIIIASQWNFNEGYKAGCFLFIICILVHSDSPNQYIQARIIQTVIGVCLGVMLALLFEFQSATAQLEKSLIKTLEQQKQLFSLIIEQTLSQEDKMDLIKPLILELRKNLKNHFELLTLTQKNWTNSLFVSRQQQRWNFLINLQILLFRHLGYLNRISLDLLSQDLTPDFSQKLQHLQDQVSIELEAVLQLIKTQSVFLGRSTRIQETNFLSAVVVDYLNPDNTSNDQNKHLSDSLPRIVLVAGLRDLLEDLYQAKLQFSDKP